MTIDELAEEDDAILEGGCLVPKITKIYPKWLHIYLSRDPTNIILIKIMEHPYGVEVVTSKLCGLS